MIKNYFFPVLAAALLSANVLSAQCGLNVTSTANTICSGDNVTLTATATPPVNALSINTTMAAGNNHRGNMFDVTAINTLTITSFDAHPMGNTTIAIYYKTGTWVGFNNNSAAWTLVGSAAVTALPMGTPTPVPVAVNVTIPAGQTYAFYVTSTNTSISLNYTDGSTVGNVYTSDANIQFREGCGLEYPFSGSPYTSRIWNGVIHYTVPQVVTTTYLWNTTATTQTINPTINNTTQYTVQASVTGCPTMYDTITVTVSHPPVSAGADFAVCDGSPATLSGSGAVSYTWDHSVTDNVPFTPAATQAYIVTGTDSIGCEGWDTVTVTVNPLPVVSAGADFAVCAGAPATLSGSGAVVYTWNNSVVDNSPFTPASTMSYIVVGTDANGCSQSDTTTVTVNALPAVDAGADFSVCAGSNATLSGSGAVSYTWDNSVTDGVPFIVMIGMDYIVTGTDANGCSNMDTVTIAALHLPGVDGGIDQVVCAGTPVTLTGSGALSYGWNNSVTDGVPFTPVSTMNYVVTGTDTNGCVNNDTVLVTVNALPNVSAGNDLNVCNEELVTLSGSGAVSYSWSNSVVDGVPFLPDPGNYTVTGTDANGCVNTDMVTITVAMPVNTTTSVVNSTITATVSGATYQWINCTTGNPIAGATSQAYTATVNGSYAVLVTVNGCTDTSACTTINDVGMDDLSAAGFSVYPNPTDGRFVINTGVAADQITVTDATGKVVMRLVPTTPKAELDLSGYAGGLYFVQVNTAGVLQTIKVVRN